MLITGCFILYTSNFPLASWLDMLNKMYADIVCSTGQRARQWVSHYLFFTLHVITCLRVANFILFLIYCTVPVLYFPSITMHRRTFHLLSTVSSLCVVGKISPDLCEVSAWHNGVGVELLWYKSKYTLQPNLRWLLITEMYFWWQRSRDGRRHWEEAAWTLMYQTNCVNRTGC